MKLKSMETVKLLRTTNVIELDNGEMITVFDFFDTTQKNGIDTIYRYANGDPILDDNLIAAIENFMDNL
jgi:hypothetical protein